MEDRRLDASIWRSLVSLLTRWSRVVAGVSALSMSVHANDVPQSVLDQARSMANQAGANIHSSVEIRNGVDPTNGALAEIGPQGGVNVITVYGQSFSFYKFPGRWEMDFDHPYFLGLLIQALIHEGLHACGSSSGIWSSSACGSNTSPFSCGHLAIDNSSCKQACDLVKNLKAERNASEDPHERCTLGEIIKGLCEAIKNVRAQWNNPKGAQVAYDCLTNNPPCVLPLSCPASAVVPPGVPGAQSAAEAYPLDEHGNPTVIAPCDECNCDICQHPPEDCDDEEGR